MTWEIRQGDALERLREIPDETVQCCVTSPPYWGLRDYGVAGQIGLEATLEEFLAAMVDVFSEIRRVMRPDGTLWLNLGDSYASKARGSDMGWDKSRLTNPGGSQKAQAASLGNHGGERHRGKSAGLKDKDLCMIPARVAMALQADGWWLRSDIIWAKPNPMPESVTDRPTRAHEYLFLLTKARRYFFDAEAIREPDVGGDHPRHVLDRVEPSGGVLPPHTGIRTHGGRNGDGRNKRSVWSIATRPHPGAHFATFPPDLVEPCILAGSPPKTCSDCGAPWERQVEVSYENPGNRSTNGPRSTERKHETAGYERRLEKRVKTTGWEPTCDHADGGGMATVLDPFAGAATTGLVATRLERDFIGLELNPEYVELGRRRIQDDAPLLNTPAEVVA